MNSNANANLAPMALDAEFQRHLNSLRDEVNASTADERDEYKGQLRLEARQTNNDAAMPLAYTNGELHSIEVRVRQTIQRFIEAVDTWGFNIDAAFEKEMIQQFNLLVSGPKTLQLPPMMKGPTIPAVQDSFARARARLANDLVREGKNKLRELKMKKKQANSAINVSFNSIQMSNSLVVADAPAKPKDEILMLKLNVHGIGVDLRALWRKVTRRKSR